MQPFKGKLESKLPKTGTTIFTVMTQMANQFGAINLSQGFPDFDCPPELVNLVYDYMKKGMNQYAPMMGILPLRQALCDKMKQLYAADFDPETEVNITSGGTQAIYTALTAILKKGDEVLVFEPAYDCYIPSIELNGGIPVIVTLEGPEFAIDWELVKSKINNKTRAIIINTPHNPTGTLLLEKDMKMLEEIVEGTDIVIISDEVYEHIIFDGKIHQSVAGYPALASRSFIIFSFGKTYHATGWKMGYCFAPANLMKEFRKVHQFIVFTSFSPVQYALADYLKNSSAYLSLPEFFRKKRDYFLDRIKSTAFRAIPSGGSYFQILDYSSISDEPDMVFAEKLLKKGGVASVPVSAFYQDSRDQKLLRFCFGKKEETLEKATQLLSNYKHLK